jgi:hypothetical protein
MNDLYGEKEKLNFINNEDLKIKLINKKDLYKENITYNIKEKDKEKIEKENSNKNTFDKISNINEEKKEFDKIKEIKKFNLKQKKYMYVKGKNKNRNKNYGNNNNNEKKAKTVFSLLSEELTNNILSKSKIKSKKENLNPFETLMNEVELQKINQKLNKNNKSIVDNFLIRNKNDVKVRQYKNQINLPERNQSSNILKLNNNNSNDNKTNPPQSPLSIYSKISKNTNTNCNTKRLNIRSPEKFYYDQLLWKETKQKNEDIKRLKSIENEDSLFTNKPRMNKYSMDLVKKRFSPIKDYNYNYNSYNNFDDLDFNTNLLKFFRSNNNNSHILDPHKRLNKTNIRNFKNDNENKFKNMYSSPRNNKKLPKKNIDELIEKLLSEKKAEDKLNKDKNNNINDIKETKEPKEISNSSNLVLLRTFLKSLYYKIKEYDILNEIEKKSLLNNDNDYKNNNINISKVITITLDQFEILLVKMGFIKKLNNNNTEVTKKILEKKCEKENSKVNKSNDFTYEKNYNNNIKLLNDAWDILSSIHSEKYGIYRVDFNLIIIFFLVILGIYRGNDKLNNEIFYLKKKENLKKIDITNKDIENYNYNLFTLENQNQNFNNDNNNLPYSNKDLLSMTFSGKNKIEKLQKIENNFKLETITQENNTSNNDNNNHNYFNKNNLNINEDSSQNIEKNLYLNTITNDIKSFFPNFDKSYFIFKNESTSNIRCLYKEFYENWADRNFENIRKRKRYSQEKPIIYKFKPTLGKVSLDLAQKSRLRYDSANMSNFSNENNINNTKLNTISNNRNIPRVEEFYDKLNIRKKM